MGSTYSISETNVFLWYTLLSSVAINCKVTKAVAAIKSSFPEMTPPPICKFSENSSKSDNPSVPKTTCNMNEINYMFDYSNGRLCFAHNVAILEVSCLKNTKHREKLMLQAYMVLYVLFCFVLFTTTGYDPKTLLEIV